MGMHVQGIDREIVSCKLQGLEDLFQGQCGTITENDDVLGGL
jgi:hypothetical protein